MLGWDLIQQWLSMCLPGEEKVPVNSSIPSEHSGGHTRRRDRDKMLENQLSKRRWGAKKCHLVTPDIQLEWEEFHVSNFRLNWNWKVGLICSSDILTFVEIRVSLPSLPTLFPTNLKIALTLCQTASPNIGPEQIGLSEKKIWKHDSSLSLMCWASNRGCVLFYYSQQCFIVTSRSGV